MAILANVSAEGRGGTDRLLAKVVDQLQAEGVRISGALRTQAAQGGPTHCHSDLWLLPTGPTAKITQDLGAGSTACRMDAGAMEEAVEQVTARLISDGADLMVLNKFGLSEAEGRGYRALIVKALSRHVPVLIGVSETHRAAFDEFAEGLATTVPPEPSAVLSWCRGAISSAPHFAEDA